MASRPIKKWKYKVAKLKEFGGNSDELDDAQKRLDELRADRDSRRRIRKIVAATPAN